MKHLFTTFSFVFTLLSFLFVYAPAQAADYLIPVTPGTSCYNSEQNQTENNRRKIYIGESGNYADLYTLCAYSHTYIVYVGHMTNTSGNLHLYLNDGDAGAHPLVNQGWTTVNETNCGSRGFNAGQNKVSLCYNNAGYNVTYIRLHDDDAQSTNTVPTDLTFYWTTKCTEGSGDKVITNSDFMFDQKGEDVIKTGTYSGTNYSTFKQNTTASSRCLVNFPTSGTYQFTFHAYSTENHSDYPIPYVFVNTLMAGGGTFSLNGGESTDVVVEMDVNAGTYPIAFYFPKYSAEEKLFFSTVSIAQASSCTAPNHVDVTPTSEEGNYGWRYSLGETLKLTATAYSSAGTSSPMDAEDITGYQWQKYIDSEWKNLTDGGDVSGATTANLQISNLTTSNGGSYRCQISTGATCTTESVGYFVRIFTLYGGYEGGSYSHQPIVWNSEKEGTVTINLNASSTYKFKFTDNDSKWYGNGGTIASDLATTWDWGFGTNDGDATLSTGGYGGGDYVLTVDITHFDDGGSKYVNLRSVVYPKKTTYLQLCSDWKAVTAKYAIYYWNGETNDWTDFMTSDACDGDILSADIPVWATKCSFGRFNSSKESTGNWDDKWNQTGDLTLSSGNDYYYNLSKGGDEKYYGTWGTFSPSTYSITFAGNGNTDGTMTNVTSIPCGEDRTLAANGYSKTGHTFANWTADVNVTINNATVTAGNPIANETTIQNITSSIALTAQWTVNSHTLTWNLDGGTVTVAGTGADVNATGSPSTSVNYGTAITAPTVTKTGYNFTSWNTTVVSPMPDEDKTYTAQWTAKTTAITIDANTSYHGSTSSSVNATWGSTLPIFTPATGDGGYSLTGYFTEATGGTKIINADGSLVASTTYTTADSKWNSELSELTLYPQYEVESCVSEYALECEDTRLATGQVTGGTATPSEAYVNSGWYKGGFSGTGFIDMSGKTGELYLRPIHLPAGTYTFNVYRINGSNRWLNIYTTQNTGHASITYNATTYYKIGSDGYSLQYNQNSENDQNQGGENDAINKYTPVTGVNLAEGDYIIGLYSNEWCSWDKVDIINTTTYTVQYATGDDHATSISAKNTETDANITYNQAVNKCTNVTFTAGVAAGYNVDYWTVNGVRYPAADGLSSFSIDISQNVTVRFYTTEASGYSVTVNRNNDAYGTASAGAATYSEGATVNLTATPASAAYYFVNWTTSSEGVSFADANSATTTFTMPGHAVTVQANFAQQMRTIQYEVVGGHGSISAKIKDTETAVTSGESLPAGTEITFTAVPEDKYNVQGWYTYESSTETMQGNTISTSFNYTLNTNITIRVKFTKIRIATGNANIGSSDGYYSANASLSVTNENDPVSKFSHKVLKVTYTMNSADADASYYGISLPVDANYNATYATGATGVGFWYRTESTTDKVLMYFCVAGNGSEHQVEMELPATNGEWKYYYFDRSAVTSTTTYGFYINGSKNGHSSGVIGSEAHLWLSEVQPVGDLTINPGETKTVPDLVRTLTIYQGGEADNTEDVNVAGSIIYIRPAKDDGTGGKLGNKLDQWYTFALPFTVSDVEVYDTDGSWYDINAVYYTNDATDQDANIPDGAGHYYLQYLKAENQTSLGSAFAARWQYITSQHSLQVSTTYGARYGYPKKDEAYIILFDSDQPIGNYFQTNTQVRYIGTGPQTIDGIGKEWKVEADGEQYWMYANNTLHSFTLTGDAYILNDAGTNFDLQTTPTIRPFECYVQATTSLKAKYASIPMRGFTIEDTPTGVDGVPDSTVSIQKVIRNGRLVIIRNGVEYDATGVMIR